jgi:hypothetical protein
VNSKLLNAILAMDSYNRGYNEGLLLGTTFTGITQIGNATVFLQDVDASAQDSGFYAIAYKYVDPITSQTQVIIAYRGTDEDITPTAKDVVHGYPVGIGIPDTSQSELAVSF